MARVRALETRLERIELRADHNQTLRQEIERRVTTLERGGFGSTPRKLDGLSTDPDNSIRRTSSGG